jgi:hypothetical protein
VREQLTALADKRKASQAAIKTATGEARKQLRAVTQAQKKLQQMAKKPGADTAPVFETARAAQDAAGVQLATIQSETQNLQATEDQLGKLATDAETAATECAAAETELRNAAAAAKKAAADARKDAAQAKSLARMPAPEALAKQREKQAKDLEALKKSSDESRAATEALKSAPPAAPAPAPQPKKAP